MSAVKPSVALIGLGNMGAPMARRLVAEQFPLKVYDASEGAREAFGASASGDIASAVADADVVVTMLPNGAIVREVLGTASKAMKKGAVVVDTSSCDAGGTVALGRELKAEGFGLVDSPVSGGVVLAGEGKLALMVGTDDEATLEKAMPVLEALGARIVRTGRLGSGHAAKAINNAIAAANIAIASEGLLMAERFGLDPEVMLDVINSSTGRSGVSETIFKTQMLTGKYALGFSLALMAKDVGIAGELGRELALDLPQLAATEDAWNAARDHLAPGADFTAFHLFVGERQDAAAS